MVFAGNNMSLYGVLDRSSCRFCPPATSCRACCIRADEPGTTQNGEGREAPMTDTMLQLLTACVEGKDLENRVFTRPNGKPVRDIGDRWAKACCSTSLGAMYSKQCGEQVPNQKPRECCGCGRRLTDGATARKPPTVP